jgi:hypothetical protein
MKKILVSALPLLLLTLFMLNGCAAKSDNGTVAANGNNGGTGAVQPTKAVLTLSTHGTVPPTTQIGGIQLTVTLPAGVSIKASPSASNAQVMMANADVVKTTGVAMGAEVVQATFSATAMSTLSVMIGKSGGFAAGDFAVLNCDIAAGSNPAAGDFSLSNFQAVDLNGAPLSGLTVGFTAAIQ